jgi:hypothetical protein
MDPDHETASFAETGIFENHSSIANRLFSSEIWIFIIFVDSRPQKVFAASDHL